MLDLQTTIKVSDDGTITVAVPDALRGQDVIVRMHIQVSDPTAWIGVPRSEQRMHHGLLRVRTTRLDGDLKRSA
jgi:hypothetical protein